MLYFLSTQSKTIKDDQQMLYRLYQSNPSLISLDSNANNIFSNANYDTRYSKNILFKTSYLRFFDKPKIVVIIDFSIIQITSQIDDVSGELVLSYDKKELHKLLIENIKSFIESSNNHLSNDFNINRLTVSSINLIHFNGKTTYNPYDRYDI
jgi:hypothetical protein